MKSFFKKTVEILESFLNMIFPQTEIEKKLKKMDSQIFYRKAIKNHKENKEFYAIFSYQDILVKSAIWSLKYRRNREIANLLAEAIYPNVFEILEDKGLFENFNNPILIYVPANQKKKTERGFDQAELIAQKLCRKLPKDTVIFGKKYLKRTKKNLNQARSVNRKQRFENLKGSMKVVKNVKNKNIILFDDVSTTGATFKEAKRILKKAGAKKIICLAVAH